MTFGWSLFMAGAIVVSACQGPGAARVGEGTAESSPPIGPKSLVIAVENEPEFLAPGFGDTSANKAASNLRLALSQRLATYDDRGDLRPMLAAALPAQEGGTWVVRPDGTMQTVYRLRPNVTWHDGAAFTAADVAFGWSVMNDPDLGQAPPPPARLINTIEVPEPLTVVIEWSKTYAFANALVGDEVGPLPRHILAGMHLNDKERLLQQPYFSRDYVGLGPYRLGEWERGSHLVLRAYDPFYAGRARIETLTVKFIPSAPTAVANLLAGAIDGALPRTLDFSQAMFVKTEWERAGRKPVVLAQPTHWRMLFVQFRDPRPREIVDARVRRALLQAIDRNAMVDTLFDGQAPVSDTFFPPDDIKWEWVKDVVRRYDYDPRRAMDLLAEAGWRRGLDGAIANPVGEQVTVPLWTTPGTQPEREQAIIADHWRAVRLGVDQMVLTAAQDRDRRFRASFPAFDGSQIPIRLDTVLARIYGPNCASEENRWAGNNRGCWQSSEMDRVNDALGVAIDPTEQRRLYRELTRALSEELPVLPLYFSVQVVIFREGVLGVRGDTRPSGSETWNVREWDVQ